MKITSPNDILEARYKALDEIARKYAVQRVGRGWAIRTKGARTEVEGIDRTKMCVPCTITTQDEDRSRDIVVTAGIDLAKHKTNPVVLWNHGAETLLPIGKSEDEGGAYTVSLHKGKARAVTYFSQKSQLAEQVFSLVEEGILRGVSIGFTLAPDGVEKRQDRGTSQGWPGLLISRCEMFEYSHVTVPDNPHALADKVGKGTLCGRPIEETLRKSLLCHLPELREMVVGGFTPPQPPVEKSMSTAAAAETNPTATTPTPAPSVEMPPTPEVITKAAPPAPVPVVAPVEDEPLDDPTWPAGASALRKIHDTIRAVGEMIDSTFQRQDSHAVKEYLNTLASTLEVWAEKAIDTWEGEYLSIDMPGGMARTLNGTDPLEAADAARRYGKRLAAARADVQARMRAEGIEGSAKSIIDQAVACVNEAVPLAKSASQRTALAMTAQSLEALKSRCTTTADLEARLEAERRITERYRSALVELQARYEETQKEFRKRLRGVR